MLQIIQRIKHELTKKGSNAMINLEIENYSEAGISILCDHLLAKENIKAAYIKADEKIKVFCKY